MRNCGLMPQYAPVGMKPEVYVGKIIDALILENTQSQSTTPKARPPEDKDTSLLSVPPGFEDVIPSRPPGPIPIRCPLPSSQAPVDMEPDIAETTGATNQFRSDASMDGLIPSRLQ